MPSSHAPCWTSRRTRRAGLPAIGLLSLILSAGSTLHCGKDPEVKAVELTKQVDTLFAQHKWEQGEKKAQDILSLSGLSAPSRDQAKLKVDQARSEQQARQQYQRFVGNKDTDTDVAVAAYRDLPETSVYRQLGRGDYEKLRPQFITDHIEKAESALQNGRCADGKSHLQQILDVDPQNQKAMDLAKKPCGKKE
ncbi:MAG TPA: hypothetical protein PKI03_06330 [Pseudomonadota bacterium]|nr:hypothetical protein [Pseudomonadota bacterium]